MTFGLQRALWAVAFAGLIAGGATAALTISSEHMPHRGAMAAVGLLVTWSFIGAGLYAWWRRPGNRFGALMTAVGFSYLLGSLMASDASVVFTIGVLLMNLYFVVFAHMLLVYPDGRLEHRWHGQLLAAAYALATLGSLPVLLWGFTDEMKCEGCPPSAILIERNDTLRDVFNTLASGIGVAFTAVVLYVLLRRWRDATPPTARA